MGSLIRICTRVVPAASGGGADSPDAFELAVVPAADHVAAQRVGRQVTDVKARKLTQEIIVGHPAASREREEEEEEDLEEPV